MLKNLKTKWWGVTILLLINLYLVSLFSEYIINREVIKEVQMILTLVIIFTTFYTTKVGINFIYNYLKKEEKND
jgi:hypothetical protein